MGKRLRKQQLLLEIKDERTRLRSFIGSLAPRQISRKGMNSSNWSIKDVLTHLNDWETRVVDWYQSGKSGNQPKVPDELFGWNQIRQLNDQIYRRHRRKSVTTVLNEFHSVHRRTLACLFKMSDKELTTVDFYSWTGTSWSLSDYFRANTASHYRWAIRKLRPWIKQMEG